MNWDEKHRRAMAVFAGDDDDLGVLLMHRQLDRRIGEIVRGAVEMRGAEGLEDVAALLMLDEEEVARRWGEGVVLGQVCRAVEQWVGEVGWKRLGEVDLRAAAEACEKWLEGREERPRWFHDVELKYGLRTVLVNLGGCVSEDGRTVTGVRLCN